jgi:hypothetical protein
MLETHIVMSSLISCLILILMFHLSFTLVLRLALLHVLFLSSLTDYHHSYDSGPRENRFEPRGFGYDRRHRHGDHLPRRSGFPAGGARTHIESRHLDGPCFPIVVHVPLGQMVSWKGL